MGGSFLAGWFALFVALGAGLLSKHILPFRAPATDERLGSSLATLRGADESGWLAVHVLYEDCRCSVLVAEHLANTRRDKAWSEVVLWVGKDVPPALGSRFDVRRVSSVELSRFGIEAAPILVALDPKNHVHYAGGYTERKQGPVIDERRLMQQARANDYVEPLPVYGCAVSARLREESSLLPTL